MISFTIKTYIPASPSEVYKAWLTGTLHTKMTGASASGRAEIGAEFSAWDGYITGKNLELVPDKEIVQAWRTTEFDEEDDDSHLEIILKPAKNNGCEITLFHGQIPEGQPDYEQGWWNHYFKPMNEYFETK